MNMAPRRHASVCVTTPTQRPLCFPRSYSLQGSLQREFLSVAHLEERLLHLGLLYQLRHHLTRLVCLRCLPPPILPSNAVRDVVHHGRHCNDVHRAVRATSVDEYAATLANWFGVPASSLAAVFPNLHRFGTPDLGFMQT